MDPQLAQLAREVRGFMPHTEGLALWRAARGCGGEASGADGLAPIVEIGSYCGKSTVYLGAAAAEAGRLVFSIDHHRGSEEMQPGWEHHDAALVDPRLADGQLDSLFEFRRTITTAGLEQTVVGVVGESTAVASHWGVSLAMLFIDGGHGQAVAHADYDAWVPHVAQGGTLAIHDVFANRELGGRPPYELYLRALGDGFSELEAVGSLRLLVRG